MEPRIQYAKASDGVNIAYWMLGQGSVPLLMTSPFAFSNISLEWQIPGLRSWYEDLSRERLLVRYDGRAQGMSQRGITDFSFESAVSDIGCIADRMSGQFDILAFAGGGMASMTFAARNPGRVRRLVLWSCPVEAFNPRERQILDGMLALAEADWNTAVETFAHAIVGWSRGQEAHEWASFIKASITREDFIRGFNEWGRPTFDLISMLPGITAPTLVIDDGTPGIGRRHARTIASGIPNAQVLQLDGPLSRFDNEKGKRAVDEFLADGELAAPVTPRAAAPSGTAIILFADIVDSTALTERMGDTPFRDKARDLDTTLRTIIREAGGTPVEGKLLGDGVLATFTSARQAIEAALKCAAAGDEGGLPLHLGLHAGDVIEEDGNVFGGAVNIAARISGLSAPGEVLVSRTVADLARTSAGVSFVDRGEHELKGVGEPVRTWAVEQQ